MTTKRASTRITVDEWRAEVERVMGRSNDEGMTSDELMEALGLGVCAVSVRLKKLRKAGKLGVGWRDSVTRIGQVRRVPVYWVKK